MGERKGAAKWYPPDYDPSKVPRVRKAKAGTKKALQEGRKFLSRKEDAGKYLDRIKIFRFHIKCTNCGSPLGIKTDPKNSTYVCDYGCTPNFQRRDDFKAEERERAEDEKRRAEDAMGTLEERTERQRAEMRDLEELAELRNNRARLEAARLRDVSTLEGSSGATPASLLQVTTEGGGRGGEGCGDGRAADDGEGGEGGRGLAAVAETAGVGATELNSEDEMLLEEFRRSRAAPGAADATGPSSTRRRSSSSSSSSGSSSFARAANPLEFSASSLPSVGPLSESSGAGAGIGTDRKRKRKRRKVEHHGAAASKPAVLQPSVAPLGVVAPAAGIGMYGGDSDDDDDNSGSNSGDGRQGANDSDDGSSSSSSSSSAPVGGGLVNY